MSPTQTKNLIIVFIIFFIFFGPLTLYRVSYSSETKVNHKVKYGSEGASFNLGFHLPFHRTNSLEGDDIAIKKFRTINLGVYTRIDIEAEHHKTGMDKSIDFTVNTGFNFYGPGGISSKKNYAEDVVLQQVNHAKKALTEDN